MIYLEAIRLGCLFSLGIEINMPNLHQIELPRPGDWQEFQRMIYDLFKRKWHDEYIQQFGKLGQGQNGIDIIGHPVDSKQIEGIQCKRVVKLLPNDIEKEYKKSEKFKPKLSRFIIATTTDRDVHVQQKAAEITSLKNYPCAVLFWEDICQLLSDFPDVLKKYYPDFCILEMLGNSPGTLVKVGIEETYFEILISRINPEDKHYKGAVLVSDLLNNKCITYRLGGHWSRLEDVVGITKYDAFVMSNWLNSFNNVESLLRLGKDKILFKPNEKDKKAFMASCRRE